MVNCVASTLMDTSTNLRVTPCHDSSTAQELTKRVRIAMKFTYVVCKRAYLQLRPEPATIALRPPPQTPVRYADSVLFRISRSVSETARYLITHQRILSILSHVQELTIYSVHHAGPRMQHGSRGRSRGRPSHSVAGADASSGLRIIVPSVARAP